MQEGKPLLPNQTRAPYHATAPYNVTEITSGLRAIWSLAFLPTGKFLVTERLPGTLRVIDEKTVYLRMPPTYVQPEALLMVLRNLLRAAHDRETNAEPPPAATPARTARDPVATMSTR